MNAAGGKVPVAVLISGRGSNFVALAEAAQDAAHPATIAVVVTDRPEAAGLAEARARGIATAVVPRRDYPSREAFDEALHAAILASGAQVVCLAGFMRILGPQMVARWEGRILNIHPSLLPAFRGLDTHARALAAGAKLHGATVHLVTAELDDGPILAQAAIPVLPEDDPASLAARVLVLEHQLYPRALAALLGAGARPHEQPPLFNPPLD